MLNEGGIMALILIGVIALVCTPLYFSEKLRRYWLFAPAFTYIIDNRSVHVDDFPQKEKSATELLNDKTSSKEEATE